VRLVVSAGCAAVVLAVVLAAFLVAVAVAESCLTMAPGGWVNATVPPLESRVSAAVGACPLAGSGVFAVSETSLPSLARHARAPSNTMLTHIL
jgi:hypothetical protein